MKEKKRTPAKTEYRIELRDYFAAQAMQAALQKLPVFGVNLPTDSNGKELTKAENNKWLAGIAFGAYIMADFMLQERKAR